LKSRKIAQTASTGASMIVLRLTLIIGLDHANAG
jgi:hypothetical protein